MAPPRHERPAWALSPCALPRLPAEATVEDLETGYARRGAAIVDCDTARQALQDHTDRERAAQDAWQRDRARRRLPAWRRWFVPSSSEAPRGER